MNAIVNQGLFRAAENDFIDMNDADTKKWLKKSYPAIMADRPVGMSEDYQFMPSHKIAERMQNDLGMRLVEVGQQHSRVRDPKGQEHFMKFRLAQDLEKFKLVGDSIPEIVIFNSHNGRSVIRGYGGIFRFVCDNGMVVSEESFGEIRLRHFGEQNSFAEFSKQIDHIALKLNLLGARIYFMQSHMLSPHDQNQLAKMLMGLRGTPDWVEAADVLEAHREEDQRESDGQRNLWVTFNVIQENLTSRSLSKDFKEQRSRSLRPLTGARSAILTNEKLWQGLENFIDKRGDRFPDLLLPKKQEPAKAAKPAGKKAKVKSA